MPIPRPSVKFSTSVLKMVMVPGQNGRFSALMEQSSTRTTSFVTGKKNFCMSVKGKSFEMFMAKRIFVVSGDRKKGFMGEKKSAKMHFIL